MWVYLCMCVCTSEHTCVRMLLNVRVPFAEDSDSICHNACDSLKTTTTESCVLWRFEHFSVNECMCVHVSCELWVYAGVCMYMYARVYVCISLCVSSCMCVREGERGDACICVCVNLWVNACVRIFAGMSAFVYDIAWCKVWKGACVSRSVLVNKSYEYKTILINDRIQNSNWIFRSLPKSRNFLQTRGEWRTDVF